MKGGNRLLYGFGITDIPSGKNGNHSREYMLWKGMIRRCYASNRSVFSDNYLECTVSDDFKLFSKFSSWYNNQEGSSIDGWCVDKDLLVKGNKIYSPETCVFLPREINTAITTSNNKRGDMPIGVFFNKKLGKYSATVSSMGKSNYLGLFNTPEQAFFAYKSKKEELMAGLAKKYIDQLSERAYNALIGFNVDIND